MFIDEENILKVLNSYNPWWRNGIMHDKYQKPMKRRAFYQIQEILSHKDLRRYAILSGARRVGKTTILYQEIDFLLNESINPKNILYVSFDNPLLKFVSLNDIIDIYKRNIAVDREIYIFLDEIQYSKDWDNWLKILYDTEPDIYAVATGSQSPVLLKGASESGAGRWITITVPTLSFYEYCLLNQKTINGEMPSITEFKSNLNEKLFNDLMLKLSCLQKDFIRYVTIGGFPELALANDDSYAQRILREDIVDKVLKRDIPELYNIRNISMLEKIFLYLCFNSSNIINYSNICQVLEKTTLATVQEYIRYLENANLIYVNEPILTSGENILKSRPKIYIVDAALRNAVLMNDDVLLNADEMGYVVETAVFRQLKTFYSKYPIGYYREKNNEYREIDAIVKTHTKNIFIEVKYREKTDIDAKNPIYSLPNNNDDIFVITKKEMDYSIKQCNNGNKIIKIPAFAYLYILGKEEYDNINL